MLTLKELARKDSSARVTSRRIEALVSEMTRARALEPEACQETARLFVERVRFTPFESIPAAEIHAELATLTTDGFLPPEAVAALEGLCSLTPAEIAEIAGALPPYPWAVLEALVQAADPEVTFASLEKILSADQVLAGELVHAANSCLVARRQPASSIRQAMVLLGLDESRRIVAAQALKPLVRGRKLEALWRHSVATAQFVETLARLARGIGPMEAFLAGLVHDIGRLVLDRAPDPAARVYRSLIEHECGPVFAEIVVAGCDHGDIGACVLETWRFPEDLIEAVRHHHQPERSRSRLASLLYLAEQRDGDEDEASGVRVDQALEWSGLTPARLKSAGAATGGRLEKLLGL